MKHKQKAPVVNPTTTTVPLVKLSEDELDMVSGSGWDKFVYKAGVRCLFCPNDNKDF